ncbi:MAG TPA: NADPH-dependent FMN reductase, partial [Candidatus Binataceae bacterium]|nr:NADPH-dependent FMN reductase [Candidatus Binataceae bacterium]
MRPTILAISGSLSRSSSNTALLQAASMLVDQSASIEVYDGVGRLPLFNVDLDVDPAPPEVAHFRARLAASEGIIISSPEYAHGISGVLKNALDWTVSSGDFYEKPVAIFNASPRASIAQESLAEVLRTMGARIIASAAVSVLLLGRNLGASGIVADAELAAMIRSGLEAFIEALKKDG